MSGAPVEHELALRAIGEPADGTVRWAIEDDVGRQVVQPFEIGIAPRVVRLAADAKTPPLVIIEATLQLPLEWRLCSRS